MIINILTLFPDVFKPLLESSILVKAQKEGGLKVKLIDLRKFGIGIHKQVDGRPYGGGVGMILRVDVIAKALHEATKRSKGAKVILLTPQGKTLNQRMAQRLAKTKHLVLLCGHYEGVDERVKNLVDSEISIGDYILSGGEVAAMVILDTVARLLPNVLAEQATQKESFSQYTIDHKSYTLLEPPQYTRPEAFRGIEVPKVLLSGNHQKIKEWRLKEALKKTKKKRTDLLKED